MTQAVPFEPRWLTADAVGPIAMRFFGSSPDANPIRVLVTESLNSSSATISHVLASFMCRSGSPAPKSPFASRSLGSYSGHASACGMHMFQFLVGGRGMSLRTKMEC